MTKKRWTVMTSDIHGNARDGYCQPDGEELGIIELVDGAEEDAIVEQLLKHDLIDRDATDIKIVYRDEDQISIDDGVWDLSRFLLLRVDEENVEVK